MVYLTLCKECKTIQRAGFPCGICNAPVLTEGIIMYYCNSCGQYIKKEEKAESPGEIVFTICVRCRCYEKNCESDNEGVFNSN